jgi:hypothetical protein
VTEHMPKKWRRTAITVASRRCPEVKSLLEP